LSIAVHLVNICRTLSRTRRRRPWSSLSDAQGVPVSEILIAVLTEALGAALLALLVAGVRRLVGPAAAV
jgi:hypothetical protein